MLTHAGLKHTSSAVQIRQLPPNKSAILMENTTKFQLEKGISLAWQCS